MVLSLVLVLLDVFFLSSLVVWFLLLGFAVKNPEFMVLYMKLY